MHPALLAALITLAVVVSGMVAALLVAALAAKWEREAEIGREAIAEHRARLDRLWPVGDDAEPVGKGPTL